MLRIGDSNRNSPVRNSFKPRGIVRVSVAVPDSLRFSSSSLSCRTPTPVGQLENGFRDSTLECEVRRTGAAPSPDHSRRTRANSPAGGNDGMLAGLHVSAGSHRVSARREFQRILEARAGSRAAALRPAGRRAPFESGDLRSARQPHPSVLARVRGRPETGPDLRIPRHRTLRPRPRAAIRSGESPPRPLRPRDRRSGRVPPRSLIASGGHDGLRHEERRRGPLDVRLGGGHAAEAPLLEDRDLRDARSRVHAASQLGSRRGQARHLRRARREDPVPSRPGRDGRRAASGLPVRHPGCARSGWSTTGATARSRSSRPTPATARGAIPWGRSTSSATWSRRFTVRGSRSSSTWCTTTRRRGTTGDRLSASAASPTTPTTSSTPTARITPTTPAPETR